MNHPRPDSRIRLAALFGGFAASLLAVVLAAQDVLSCPNCKEAVASQTGSASGQAYGYYWSIIAMVAMPFLLTGAGALLLVLSCRRAARSAGRP